jgi:hypothetical protein
LSTFANAYKSAQNDKTGMYRLTAGTDMFAQAVVLCWQYASAL